MLSFMVWLSVLGLVAAVYFVPTFITMVRSHHQTLGIFVVNLIGGITGIAWIAALIWSLLPARPTPTHYREHGWW